MSSVTPSPSDIQRIANLSDPILRNLHITQCYHQLALVLAERTGREANWCAFATWASKQAGQTIRHEDLSRTLEPIQNELNAILAIEKWAAAVQKFGIRLERHKLIRLLWQAADPQAALARSSDAVARGNLKVFAEIGDVFARFYAQCLSDTLYNQANITRFLSELRPGPPPNGQDFLRRAFQNTYRSLFEPNEKARSELLFLANLQIGFHEQTRLQPEINEALSAPVLLPHAFVQNLLRAYYPNHRQLADFLAWLLSTFGRMIGFDTFVEAYLEGARGQIQRTITALLMTIELPHIRLRLGDDLSAEFPPCLRQITNPDLVDLLAQVDPTPGSLHESGARQWGDLFDRLHFIADMFRSYHTASPLFEPPFTPEQVEILFQDRVPPGRL